jgi:dTDP-4-dehydrorhamnose reductase
VNAAGPANLAELAYAHVLFTSRRIILRWHRDASVPYSDSTEPLSVYAASKLEGEKRVLSRCPERGLILRSGWIYYAGGQNFVTTMLNLMRERQQIRVVADQIGMPPCAITLARVIWRAAELSRACGVYHWSDAGECSWYDFAVAIQEEALALRLLTRPIAIRPICTNEYPTPARRPAFTVLDKTATVTGFGLKPIHWRVALRQMLAELANA